LNLSRFRAATPVKSPQSDGVQEASVNPLKRYYVNITLLPDAATVLGLFTGLFEDYNDNPPKRGVVTHARATSSIN